MFQEARDSNRFPLRVALSWRQGYGEGGGRAAVRSKTGPMPPQVAAALRQALASAASQLDPLDPSSAGTSAQPRGAPSGSAGAAAGSIADSACDALLAAAVALLDAGLEGHSYNVTRFALAACYEDAEAAAAATASGRGIASFFQAGRSDRGCSVAAAALEGEASSTAERTQRDCGALASSCLPGTALHVNGSAGCSSIERNNCSNEAADYAFAMQLQQDEWKRGGRPGGGPPVAAAGPMGVACNATGGQPGSSTAGKKARGPLGSLFFKGRGE